MRCLAFVLLAGCTVGTLDGGGGGTTDNNSSPDGGAADGATVTADAATFACRNKVTSGIGNGHHNAGQDCQGGCHNHGFTLSGTIYAGTTALSGATITVKDATNHTFDVVSQANGNFYTINAVVFPITVVASMCPDVAKMSSQITSGNGGCNKSGCHTTTAQGRIHLP